MATALPEPQALNAVHAFHTLFGAYVGESPAIPTPDVCTLRINLLQEELNELAEAIHNNDIVEVADALTDLQYVLSGAVLAFGLQDRFAALFAEVQRSNMSKACATLEEAEATAKWYLTEKNMASSIVEKEGKYIVLRTGDSKVLKSIAYSPAQLAPLVETPVDTSQGFRVDALQENPHPQA